MQQQARAEKSRQEQLTWAELVGLEGWLLGDHVAVALEEDVLVAAHALELGAIKVIKLDLQVAQDVGLQSARTTNRVSPMVD